MTPPRTLGERLQRLRAARFVGREAELRRFQAMLDGRDPHALLFIHGPGGIGKTTLLSEFARLAEQAGRNVVALDGRLIPASQEAFVDAFHEALGHADKHAQSCEPEKLVLTIDTLERLGSLETWLLREHLPSLPADAIVVLAGRSPVGRDWLLEPGCAELAQGQALGALHHEQARTLLAARGVPAEHLDRVTELARGNPLALALLADAVRQGRTDVLASASERRLLLRSLTARFAADAPSPHHELALKTLMLARTTTESMLADVVSREDASALHDWLRSLSFVEEGDHGLQPHDLVREAFEADWFARGSDAIEPLRLALMQHLQRRLMRLGQHERHRIAYEWTYLTRDTPAWQVLDWTHFEHHTSARLRPQDHGEVIDQVSRAHGPASARIAQHWLHRQPMAWWGVIGTQGVQQGRLRGCWLVLDLHQISPADREADPGLNAVMQHLDGLATFDQGDLLQLTRFATFEGRTDLPSPTFDLGVRQASIEYMTQPRLAWTGIFSPEIDRLQAFFDHTRRYHWHDPVAQISEVLDERVHGLFARQWRDEPNPLWWGQAPGWRPSPQALRQLKAPAATLDRDAFAAAVREALKTWSRPDLLAGNPLLNSDLMRARNAAPDVSSLREMLREAVHALAEHPRDQKFHHALRLTWIDPGLSQERVAAELGLPFNTYRYHLSRGLERVASLLWQQELQAGIKATPCA